MRTVAVVIFEKLAPLDMYGPIQALNLSFAPGTQEPLYKIITVGSKRVPVPTGFGGTGPATVVDCTFEDISYADIKYDVLLIPGGIGTRALVKDKAFIENLRNASSRADITATVCTGAALLARTGLLDCKRATSNKKAWDWVVKQGPKVCWDREARWVNLITSDEPHTGFITSAGVSAGIDMCLDLIKCLDGEEVARNSAESMEYEWHSDPNWDPFA